jgi:2-succinyl-6-hydroxy-2,4-cyclohexadiene-1-carboxylate synthase
LLHGFTGSGRSFERVAALLGDSSRVLAPDLPGHGRSRFGDDPRAHTMEAVAAALDQALAALAVERLALAGYSMGGRLALYYALTRPRAVMRLVLESASAGIAADAERDARMRADDELARHVLEAGIESFVERWEKTPVLATLGRLPADERARIRELRLACAPAGLAASLRGMGTGVQPYLGRRLGELRIPTLIMAGAEDAKFCVIARTLAASIDGSTLEIVPGVGHTPHLEAPARWAEIVGKFVNAGSRAG